MIHFGYVTHFNKFHEKNNNSIIFGLKVGGTAVEMFKYQLPDGSVFDNSLFCQGNF
jgi:hypothetical protein